MGIGSYITSYLTVELHWPITAALIAAAAAASLIGVIVGFPALRLKGIYLSPSPGSRASAEMARSSFLNFSPMGGSGGYHGMQQVSLGYIWTWAAGILLFVMMLERSRLWLECAPSTMMKPPPG